jgi:TolB-like protein/tetratricopeptide (TPR) repeat protein
VAGLLVVGLAGIVAWALPRFAHAPPGAGPPPLSVAVLPFTAPPGSVDASQFAEALTRYLLTGLPTKREYGHVLVVSAAPATGIDTRASDPRELGRQFNVRYVLEGDVLRDGKSNTVNFRLVDTATRSQVWSGRETFQDADVVSGSSVPLRVVATSLRYALIDAEIRRVKVPPIAALSASELVLRAFALGGEDPSLAGLSGAGKLVDEALRLEPDLVPALVLRAALINNEFEVDPSADRNRMTREQDRLTARAVQLDSADPAAWAWRAAALGSVGRWNAALEASAAAIKLDPYEPRWYLLRAGDMILMARLDDALEMANRALALYPGSALATATACEVHVLAGRTEEAIATCERASGHADDWAIHLALAAAYANHGEMAKAAAAKAEVLRIIPGLTIAQLRAKRASDNPEYVTLAETYWYAGLRKAGLPEK